MTIYNGILSQTDGYNTDSYGYETPNLLVANRDMGNGGNTFLGQPRSIMSGDYNAPGNILTAMSQARTAASDAEWNAGAGNRQYENLIGLGYNKEDARLLTAGDYEGAINNNGPTELQGAIVGEGVKIAGDIAENVSIGVQNKRLREKAEENAMADLAANRAIRDKENNMLNATEAVKQKQTKAEQLRAVAGLRMEMLQNDLAQELQDYNDKKAMVEKFRRASAQNGALKDALVQRMSGGK